MPDRHFGTPSATAQPRGVASRRGSVPRDGAVGLKDRAEEVYRLLHSVTEAGLDCDADIFAGEGLSDAEGWLRMETQVWVGLWVRSLVDDDSDYLAVF
jgi:hypothetical protein